MTDRLSVDDIKFVIHPNEQICVGVSHNGDPDLHDDSRPVALDIPLVWSKYLTFTKIYPQSSRYLTSGWWDGGEDADHMFWVYLTNQKLRDLFPSDLDSENLFDWLRMVGQYSSLSILLVAEDGTHHILSYKENERRFTVEVRVVDVVTVVGDFGVMGADDFCRRLQAQTERKLYAQLEKALSLPTNE